jgi:AdoMet-dependent rRNA methyltransferase SPB1
MQQRKMKKKKETRRERVMAAWSGALGAFNEALDENAYHQHLLDQRADGEETEDDGDDDDDDDDADLLALRCQQKALFDGVDNDAMESSLAGPALSEAAADIMGDRKKTLEKKAKADAMALKDGDEVDLDQLAVEDAAEETQLDTLKEQHRANRWFSQDIFKNVGTTSQDIIPLDRDSESESESQEVKEVDDKLLPKMPLTDKEKRKLKRKKEQEKLEYLGKKPKAVDNTPLEVAPLEAPQPLVMTGPQKPSDPRELAETMALGSLLVDSKKSRMDLIDASYNRWTFDGDEALPDWFTEDENKHNKPELPITKEMMAQFKAKLREINARPIRKVAEAKARKGRRLKLKLDKLRKTAMSLTDAPDMSEAAKARLMRKQVSRMVNSDQRQVTTVAIAKGGGGRRGGKEKGKVPKGAKTKVVDKRLKSDARSQKRADKKAGGKGRAKARKMQVKKQNKTKGGGGRKNSGGKN